MKMSLRKIGAATILSLAFCGLLLPALPVQGAQLFDTLDTIKSNTEKGTGGVSILDFANTRPWGNLPEETKVLLMPPAGNYDNLDQIIQEAGKAVTEGDAVSVEAYVKEIPGMADKAGGELNRHGFLLLGEIIYQGESQLNAVVLAVVKVVRNLIGSLAIVFIVVSGILMIFAQGEESKITEQKRSITYAIIGLVIILLIERMISAIYGVPGEQRALTTASAALVSAEIYGLISYIKAILGSVAVFMIVLNGFKTVTAQGDEEVMKTQRNAILWTIIGLALIVINKVVVENIFIGPATSASGQITKTNVQNILDLFGRIAQYLMGFAGLVAFAALIYGAGSMIANFGEDEGAERAKKIVKNSAIGIVIILSAYAIVATMIRSA